MESTNQTISNDQIYLDMYRQSQKRFHINKSAVYGILGFLVVSALVTGGLLFAKTELNKPNTESAQAAPAPFVVSPSNAPASWTQALEREHKPAPTKTVPLVAGTSIIDSDFDSLPNAEEFRLGTNPYNTDTDGDGYFDGIEVKFGYDPTGEGRPYMDVVIPKIDKIAPISFPTSRKESDIQRAMEEGAAWYPGTAVPGTTGNTYITGHSSDYLWRSGNFKRVFRQLYKVEAGDTFYIRSTQSNGVVTTYAFEVYDVRVTQVDDPVLWYADRDGSIVTLVTSWPLDSTRERLMVRGQLSNQ